MSHEARAKRATARRAVLAMLQDEEIRFDMINDLDKRVERAVAIAMATKTSKAAIELAAAARVAEYKKGRR